MLTSRGLVTAALPGFLPATLVTNSSPLSAQNTQWISHTEAEQEDPLSTLRQITAMVRNLTSPAPDSPEPVLLAHQDSRWKDRTARAWDQVGAEQHESPRPLNIKRRSRLSVASKRGSRRHSRSSDIELTPFEREEEANLADESADEEDDLDYELAVTLTINPTHSHAQQGRDTLLSLEVSVVLRGSDFDLSATNEDNRTEDMADLHEEEVGEVRCATLRPVTRTSDSEGSEGSRFELRSTGQRRRPSVGSLASFRTEGQATTSVGFQNMIMSRGGSKSSCLHVCRQREGKS